MIIMACHNKAYTWDALLLGSVADYATHNSTLPVRCSSSKWGVDRVEGLCSGCITVRNGKNSPGCAAARRLLCFLA